MNQQNHPGNPEQRSEQNPEERSEEGRRGLTPSDAPNASFETGAGMEEDFDSPPIGSMTLSNPEYYEGNNARAEGDVPPDEYEDISPV